MATVTGYTKAAMDAIRDGTIVSLAIDGSGHLIATYYDASTADLGLVEGPAGPSFDGGSENDVLAKNSVTDGDYKWLDVVALVQASPIPTTSVSGTTYTVLSTDVGKQIECDNAAKTTVTIDTQANQAIPVGLVIPVFAGGAGGVEIDLASGVTSVGSPKLNISQGEMIALKRKSSDLWFVIGGTAT